MSNFSTTDRESEKAGAVILAGGLSTRMGRNKVLLPYKDHTLLDHMVKLLAKSGFDPVLISGDIEGYVSIADQICEKGPVGGIHAVVSKVSMVLSPRAWLFVPVDMPLLNEKMLKRLAMCKCAYKSDGAVFHDRPLPLFIRMHDHVIDSINSVATRMRAGETISVNHLLSHLNLCKTKYTSHEAVLLMNTNTPEEWQEAIREFTH